VNVLLIGVGDAGLGDPSSEPVARHLEYARRIGGHIDLIVDSPAGGRSDFGALTVHRTGAGRMRFPAAAYRLARTAAKKNPPDVIMTQDPFATALAGLWARRALRCPLLVQNHSCVLFNRHWIGERPVVFRMLHLLARWILPRADAWRVVNTNERKIYIDRLGLPAERICVLPVPCDLAPFAGERTPDRAIRARGRLHLPPGVPIVAWAGRPVRFKRLPVLFRAFAKIRAGFPDALLIIAGRKELAQEDLDRSAEENNLGRSLIWTGELARGGLAAVYRAADLYLHSSIYEGFGRVLVEAGAAGLAAVSTATAGASDILRDGETGFLAPLEDAAALASRARDLLSDPGKSARMGAAACNRIRAEFDPEKMFEAIVAQWRETASAGVRS
jgi:glycosyltransferase involved in cell wall biosynthesis